MLHLASLVGRALVATVLVAWLAAANPVAQSAITVSQVEWENPPLRVSAIRGNDSADPLSDLTIDLENVSEKPVYYIDLNISFPEWQVDGGEVGYPLQFGTREIWTKPRAATRADAGVGPGEKVTLRLDPEMVRLLKTVAIKHGLPRLSRATLNLSIASFGDLTEWHAGHIAASEHRPYVLLSPAPN